METPRVLLDTNVLLAALMGPDRLNEATRELLVAPARDVRFSAASVWEVAIKRSLQRERFDFEPAEVHELALRSGFVELPVRAEHVYGLSALPMHHRDPFDRLLVCQAGALGARLLTGDRGLEPYGEVVMTVPLGTEEVGG